MRLRLLPLLFAICPLPAADHFALVALGDLTVDGEALPERIEPSAGAEASGEHLPVVVEAGEGWLPTRRAESGDGGSVLEELRTAAIAVRSTALPIRGRLLLPTGDGARVVRFTVPADRVRDEADWQWRLTAALVDRDLVARGVPGAAFFRHRLADLGIAERTASPWEGGRRADDLDGLMDLVGGGRAIDENLSLGRAQPLVGSAERIARIGAQQPFAALVQERHADEAAVRRLNRLGDGPVAAGTLVMLADPDAEPWRPDDAPADPAAPAPAAVPMADLPGIDIPAIDWSKHPAGAVVADPAAAVIPEDQHAVFAPDVPTVLAAMAAIDQLGTPVRSLLEAGSGDARIAERYRRQLCLDASDLARLLGPTLIQQVACTGADPFLRSGSDVAVLFTPRQQGLLIAALGARQEAAIAADRAVRSTGTILGTAWSGVATADRAVCSYLATVGGQVVVTNSLAGLQRLIETAAGTRPALGASNDYRFFRSRYPAAEGGLLAVLSDATIRRWSSAPWRIADARRQRAAARLAGIGIAQADWVVRQREPRPAPLEDGLLGHVDSTSGRPVSARYGTTAFLTPLVEGLPTTASAAEAEAYRRWLDGYRRAWTRSFDPIAVRIQADGAAISTDATVMPLTRRSELREFIELTRGGKLVPGAGDPHDGMLAQFALAVDLRSQLGREAGDTLKGIGGRFGIDPLRWIGGWAAIGLAQDDAWLAKAPAAGGFLGEMADVPLLVHIPSKDPLALAAFLTGLRALADQSAPGLMTWDTRTDEGRGYVAIVPAQEGGGMPAIYYAATADALILSANEGVLRAALRRHAAKPASTTTWLGEHLGLRLASPARLLALSRRLHAEEDPVRAIQQRSWANLPLLAALAARFPGVDPALAWELLAGERPSCAGGGTYAADADGFLASSVYGSPARPAGAETLPPGLSLVESIEAGATFEDDGLRARLVLHRAVQP